MSLNMQEQQLSEGNHNLREDRAGPLDSLLKNIVSPGNISESLAIVGSFLAIALIFAVDVVTDPVITFQILYVFPLALIALHSSKTKWVVGALLLSVLFQCMYSFIVPHQTLGTSAYFYLLIALSNTMCTLAARYSRAHTLEVKHLSCIDPLTNLCNRRGFDKAMSREVLRQRRYGGHCSLALIDLDGFKGLNDTRGHDVGDQALILLADILRNQIRKTDTIARLGGDEFVILMPNTTAADSRVICQLLCHSIRFQLTEALSYPLSASIGFTTVEDAEDASLDMLVVADKALYEAKEQGKACAVKG